MNSKIIPSVTSAIFIIAYVCVGWYGIYQLGKHFEMNGFLACLIWFCLIFTLGERDGEKINVINNVFGKNIGRRLSMATFAGFAIFGLITLFA